MSKPFKIPQSVLVVIHTPALEVLLIKRADAEDFWQSVTGAKDSLDEDFRDTAVREVLEETGIDCGPGTPLTTGLRDWQLENVYEIYPRWRHRYAPGVTRNTEHLFSLRVPAGTSSGRKFRVKGAGVQRKNITGDLIVTVEVAVPQRLSAEAKAALETFAKAQREDPRQAITRALRSRESAGSGAGSAGGP